MIFLKFHSTAVKTNKILCFAWTPSLYTTYCSWLCPSLIRSTYLHWAGKTSCPFGPLTCIYYQTSKSCVKSGSFIHIPGPQLNQQKPLNVMWSREICLKSNMQHFQFSIWLKCSLGFDVATESIQSILLYFYFFSWASAPRISERTL